MHIYPLRCCLDSLYVVGAVNNGARLRKLPILIRNRIDAIFRHRPLQRSHTCRKHRIRGSVPLQNAHHLHHWVNAWHHKSRTCGRWISKAAIAESQTLRRFRIGKLLQQWAYPARLQRCAVAFAAIAPYAVQDRCLGPDACIHAFALTPSARDAPCHATAMSKTRCLRPNSFDSVRQ